MDSQIRCVIRRVAARLAPPRRLARSSDSHLGIVIIVITIDRELHLRTNRESRTTTPRESGANSLVIRDPRESIAKIYCARARAQ